MDWNNDGKLDLVAGDASGQVWLFLNQGTPQEPRLRSGVQLEAGGRAILGVPPHYEKGKDGHYALVPNQKDLIGIYSKIHVADWDGDGLRDLLVGQDGPGQHSMLWYRNIGTQGKPVLDNPKPLELPGPHLSRPSPYVCDWDGDGKADLVCGTETHAVYFFRNVGGAGPPQLAQGVPLQLEGDGFAKGYRCRIHVCDWNNDGKQDLLVGNFCSQGQTHGGNVWLFLAK